MMAPRIRGFAMIVLRSSALLFATVLAAPACAHTELVPDGFATGLLHPFLGIDHLLALAAVGLWAGLVGGPALWAWPAAFLSTMVVGALAGTIGTGVQGIELAVAASVVVLGLAVALQARLPLLGGAALCAAFAFVHGHAHGAELPAGSDATFYLAGMSLASAFLHASGIALSTARNRAERIWSPGLAGSAIAVVGLLLF